MYYSMSYADRKQHTATASVPKPELIDPKAERRLVMKLDLIIFAVFFVVYIIEVLDCTNISNAAI